MSEIQSNTPQLTVDVVAKQEKSALNPAQREGRFRILIVGRANAGKTTILKKICNTTDEPEIYNSIGERIDTSSVEPTAQRGIHGIENELIFRSNPGFIFHDSCGFEAGGVDELNKVKAFISKCSNEKRLRDKVHVIWYCIPMDDCRPITHAEIQFFSTYGTGKVPVIVVFTKCEALELQAIDTLEQDMNLSYGEAVKQAPAYANKYLHNTHLELEKERYPPLDHVYLQEMEKIDKNCSELVEATAAVLDSDILQALFVSTQQNGLAVSMKYSIRWIIKEVLQEGSTRIIAEKNRDRFLLDWMKTIMAYYPYSVSKK